MDKLMAVVAVVAVVLAEVLAVAKRTLERELANLQKMGIIGSRGQYKCRTLGAVN